MQAIAFKQNGKYIRYQKDLSQVLSEDEKIIVDTFLSMKTGGGAVHFCGRGDHYIEIMASIQDLTAINMSQPHLNDMEKIYRNTVDHGIKILGFDPIWAENDKARGFSGNLSV